MDLYSGLPYWIAKNPLHDYFHPLTEDIQTEVAIIGAGITGTLVAHELCKAGIECSVFDKRTLTTGSTIASTALLQYEIDTPLCKLSEMIGEGAAVKAYHSCLQSINDLEHVFMELQIHPDFMRVPSIWYASDRRGLTLVREELEIRNRFDLPVIYFSKKELEDKYGLRAPGALVNYSSAQVDPYKAATSILGHYMEKEELAVYTHTEINNWKETTEGYMLTTVNGNTIRCRYVVVAAGFEAGRFLPKKLMKLTSTYAILSEPVDKHFLWPGHSLIWETREPYLYVRTNNQNRIIVGGEDEEFRDSVKRDQLIRKKVAILEKKIKKLFPDIPFRTDMAWCGTFSSTEDGLPLIGAWPGKERMLYALGYGGNGITFSMTAAQLIRHKIQGIKDERESVFGFERLNKKYE